MLYGIIGVLIIAIIILIIKLSKKQIIDKNEYTTYQNSLNQLINEKNNLQNELSCKQILLTDYQEKILTVQKKYREELNKKTEDLDLYFENQKLTRQSEMDTDFERLWREKEENLNNKYIKLEREELEKEHKIRQEVQENIDAALKSQNDIVTDTQYQQQRYESLLMPIKMYETNLNEKLFYTVQIPDQAKEDIDYLINFAAKKVHHPDIVSKIIWTEYVKPYLDQTFKRIEIKEEPGIYKITNIDNGKSYIGKSTNVKRRITDHYKGACGISTISKQLVHDKMATSGLWNWTIEIITYCEKDKLNELEKYYIDFFKSNEWGFNKTKGGEG